MKVAADGKVLSIIQRQHQIAQCDLVDSESELRSRARDPDNVLTSHLQTPSNASGHFQQEKTEHRGVLVGVAPACLLLSRMSVPIKPVTTPFFRPGPNFSRKSIRLKVPLCPRVHLAMLPWIWKSPF